jgi:hypothetical protein
LREECRRRVFENRVLRRKFGPKMYEVTREMLCVRNQVLQNLKFKTRSDGSINLAPPIIQGVSGGIVNVLGGGSMDYSE